MQRNVLQERKIGGCVCLRVCSLRPLFGRKRFEFKCDRMCVRSTKSVWNKQKVAIGVKAWWMCVWKWESKCVTWIKWVREWKSDVWRVWESEWVTCLKKSAGPTDVRERKKKKEKKKEEKKRERGKDGMLWIVVRCGVVRLERFWNVKKIRKRGCT